MKKIIVFILLVMFSSFGKGVDFGFKPMFGGRYDNLRMCVASDAGVKGGIIADIMFLSRFQTSRENLKLALEIPVMRPVLFAVSYDMLQFEPELTFEFSKSLGDKKSLIYGPGAGMSFNYGPDYLSDQDNRGDDFFSVGPMLSGTFGFAKLSKKGNERRIALRAFYIPLFPTDGVHSVGTVLGAVIEGHFYF